MSTTALPETSPRPDLLLRPPVQVVAHRGASARAPENTLSAVRAAIACGADAVEIDVRRSRDGEFVVLHDPTLGRTTDVGVPPWKRTAPRVDQLTLAELRRLDAGSWKAPSFVGERIPTLAEVMDLLASSRVGLLVELKRPVGSEPRHLTDLAALIRETALPHRRITVQSFDAHVVHDLRHLLPSVSLGVLARSVPRDLAAVSRWADQVGLHHKSLDHRAVDHVKGWGMRCVTWTVNRHGSMRRVLDLGVDGVITDHPDALLDLMAPAQEAAAGAR